jgi:hypothetical protein
MVTVNITSNRPTPLVAGYFGPPQRGPLSTVYIHEVVTNLYTVVEEIIKRKESPLATKYVSH